MKAEIKQRAEMIRKGDVPEGYKETKVGIIPGDWEVDDLSALGTFSKGKGISSKDIVEVGLPAIMYGDIYVKFDTYFQKADQKITKETAKKSSPIKKGDLLFTTSGETAEEIGKCVCYLGNETVYIGGDIIKFSPDKTDSLYLAYLQNSFSQIKQKATLGQGFSVVHIYKSNLDNLQIPYPDKDEQTAIANILSTADKAIETTETLITLKQKKKKWLMQNLLTGKVRLPEYDNCPVPVQERIRMINDGIVPEGYKQTKVGIIPEDWELEAIKNVSEIINGGTPSTINPEYWGDEILWCTPTDITKCKTKYLFKTERGISKKGLKNSSATLVPKGSLLLCSRATIGEVRIASNEISTNQGFKSLVCKKDCYNEFLYYLISSSHVKKQLKQKAIGSTFLEISKKDISKFLIVFPSLQEQTAIANILSTADKEIDLLNQKLDTLKQQKKALMQLLLTGIVRTTGLKSN